MTIEQLKTASVICWTLSGVLLAVTVLLFFLLNIRKVVGSLSGAAAKKAIRQIRERNAAGSAASRAALPQREGRVTDKITGSGSLRQERGGAGSRAHPAGESQPTTVLEQGGAETTVLADASDSETTVLPQAAGTFSLDAEISFLASREGIEPL